MECIFCRSECELKVQFCPESDFWLTKTQYVSADTWKMEGFSSRKDMKDSMYSRAKVSVVQVNSNIFTDDNIAVFTLYRG